MRSRVQSSSTSVTGTWSATLKVRCKSEKRSPPSEHGLCHRTSTLHAAWLTMSTVMESLRELMRSLWAKGSKKDKQAIVVLGPLLVIGVIALLIADATHKRSDSQGVDNAPIVGVPHTTPRHRPRSLASQTLQPVTHPHIGGSRSQLGRRNVSSARSHGRSFSLTRKSMIPVTAHNPQAAGTGVRDEVAPQSPGLWTSLVLLSGGPPGKRDQDPREGGVHDPSLRDRRCQLAEQRPR